MILPIQAALERVPANYIEASADLGAEPRQTFWTVIFPLALPGIIAGSIFTFSLTLGDYIVPTIVGNSRLMVCVREMKRVRVSRARRVHALTGLLPPRGY